MGWSSGTNRKAAQILNNGAEEGLGNACIERPVQALVGLGVYDNEWGNDQVDGVVETAQ